MRAQSVISAGAVPSCAAVESRQSSSSEARQMM